MAIEPITKPVFTQSETGNQQNRANAQHGHMVEEGTSKPFKWDLALVWFMRLLAIAWMAKGLAYWAMLLGFMPHIAQFEAQNIQSQSAIVYFAVIDLIAAIGLWLTSAWGGVTWLFAAMSYLIVAILMPHTIVSSPLALGALGILVVVYFVLSWHASRIKH